MHRRWILHHHSFPPLITQTYYVADVTVTLRQFGLGGLTTALEADGVREIWNLLSLQHDLYSKFNSLDLWFESTSKVRHSETFH